MNPFQIAIVLMCGLFPPIESQGFSAKKVRTLFRNRHKEKSPLGDFLMRAQFDGGGILDT
jgi:hypothetical protein